MPRYVTINDLYQRFGQTNVRRWADPDGKGNVDIDAVIMDAIEDAEEELHDALRNGRYALPLVFSSGTGRTVKRIVMGLAGWLLYGMRGVREEDADTPVMRGHHDEAVSLMTRVSTGELTLDAQRPYPTDPTAPVAVI